MNKFYVVLSRSHTTVALLVRFFTRKYYSHTSIGLEKDLSTFYSFGRKNPRYLLPAGMIKEGISKGYFAYRPGTKIMVLEGELNNEEYELLKEHLEEFEEKREWYRYNLLGLPLSFLQIPHERKRHYNCSSFVAYLFRDILEFERHYSLTEPEDFYKFNFKKIYEGRAGDYTYEKF